jgi:putative glutamine amidotransferase
MPGCPAVPTIGVTLPSRAADLKAQRRANRLAARYRAAIEVHGVRWIELPPDSPPTVLDGLDGVLLTGGGDIHPSRYGQTPHPKLGHVDHARDQFELLLARGALSRGIPLLGICRGAQVLGVALGGDLVQDIDSDVEDAKKHPAGGRGNASHHCIEIAPGSHLSQIMGARRVRVNSSHHQANGRLGSGVRKVAWSEDGVIEAIEREEEGFVLGVQWHPERMWRKAPRQSRLFAAFAAAASGGGNDSYRG